MAGLHQLPPLQPPASTGVHEPNRWPCRVDHVTLGIPSDFELDDAETKPGWAQSRTGQAITWSGNRIPKGQYATFSIRGTAPTLNRTLLNGHAIATGDSTPSWMR